LTWNSPGQRAKRRYPLILLVALVLVAAAPARATTLDDAASALRGDPVYAARDAETRLTSSEERRLERLIADRAGGPLYVAVLPASAGDATDAAGAVLSRVKVMAVPVNVLPALFVAFACTV